MIGAIGQASSSFPLRYGAKAKVPPVAPVLRRTEQDSEKKDLLELKQTIENQLLLMKSSTDSAAVSEEIQQELQEALQKISEELKIADTQEISGDAQLAQSSLLKTRFDSYEPQPGNPPTGLYEVTADENGNPVISFDDPEREAGRGSEAADRGEDKPDSVNTTVNTDQVDKEIAQLRQAIEQLGRQLAMADEEEKPSLEAELAQMEQELQQKDNDTYRRQHADVRQESVDP